MTIDDIKFGNQNGTYYVLFPGDRRPRPITETQTLVFGAIIDELKAHRSAMSMPEVTVAAPTTGGISGEKRKKPAARKTKRKVK